MAVILETSVGDITIDLYCEERPRCCENFLKLCKVKYYNFCAFHNVQRNLVAQTGDPTETGRGGESIFAKLYGEQAKFFEAENKPRIKHTKIGTVSMVNGGNNMHGSQFFLTLAPNIDYLDGKHSVFGEVAEGEDVLKIINEAFTDDKHRPYKDIRIYHTVVLDDPFDDPPRLAEFIPAASPEPTKQQMDGVRIGVEEDINDNAGKTVEEIEEALQHSEAKANAQILEMVGDLPSVDVKPEDTVLFVCKLNPVTTSEDLEIIFSRFGKIISCEIIKDQKTEESLQYAFIEFEKESECENAYFKMDNVLIDDRRIHVDFSQSVSRLKPEPAGQQDGQKYVIKDRSKKDKYEYVFSDEEDEVRIESKNKMVKPKSSKTKTEHAINRDEPERRRDEPERRRDEPERRRDESERRRDEPERRRDEPERRRDEPERRRDEPERRRDEPERRRDEPERRRDEPERRRDEPERRRDEPERRRDEPERRRNEPERRRDEPERRGDESERQLKHKSNSRQESSRSRHRSRSRSAEKSKQRSKDGHERRHRDDDREDNSRSKHHKSHKGHRTHEDSDTRRERRH